MAKTLIPVAVFLFCAFGFAQPTPTMLPPPIACTAAQATQIASKAINDSIQTTIVRTSIKAKGFAIGAVTMSGEADSSTGYAKSITFSYTVVDNSNQPIGTGMFDLDGECRVNGGSLSVQVNPLPIVDLQ